MKVIKSKPYSCADLFLVRSLLYQNKLALGEMKPITSNAKQAKINKNKIFSNSTNSFFADDCKKLKRVNSKLRKNNYIEQLHLALRTMRNAMHVNGMTYHFKQHGEIYDRQQEHGDSSIKKIGRDKPVN